MNPPPQTLPASPENLHDKFITGPNMVNFDEVLQDSLKLFKPVKKEAAPKNPKGRTPVCPSNSILTRSPKKYTITLQKPEILNAESEAERKEWQGYSSDSDNFPAYIYWLGYIHTVYAIFTGLDLSDPDTAAQLYRQWQADNDEQLYRPLNPLNPSALDPTTLTVNLGWESKDTHYTLPYPLPRLVTGSNPNPPPPPFQPEIVWSPGTRFNTYDATDEKDFIKRRVDKLKATLDAILWQLQTKVDAYYEQYDDRGHPHYKHDKKIAESKLNGLFGGAARHLHSEMTKLKRGYGLKRAALNFVGALIPAIYIAYGLLEHQRRSPDAASFFGYLATKNRKADFLESLASTLYYPAGLVAAFLVLVIMYWVLGSQRIAPVRHEESPDPDPSNVVLIVSGAVVAFAIIVFVLIFIVIGWSSLDSSKLDDSKLNPTIIVFDGKDVWFYVILLILIIVFAISIVVGATLNSKPGRGRAFRTKPRPLNNSNLGKLKERCLNCRNSTSLAVIVTVLVLGFFWILEIVAAFRQTDQVYLKKALESQDMYFWFQDWFPLSPGWHLTLILLCGLICALVVIFTKFDDAYTVRGIVGTWLHRVVQGIFILNKPEFTDSQDLHLAANPGLGLGATGALPTALNENVRLEAAQVAEGLQLWMLSEDKLKLWHFHDSKFDAHPHSRLVVPLPKDWLLTRTPGTVTDYNATPVFINLIKLDHLWRHYSLLYLNDGQDLLLYKVITQSPQWDKTYQHEFEELAATGLKPEVKAVPNYLSPEVKTTVSLRADAKIGRGVTSFYSHDYLSWRDGRSERQRHLLVYKDPSGKWHLEWFTTRLDNSGEEFKLGELADKPGYNVSDELKAEFDTLAATKTKVKLYRTNLKSDLIYVVFEAQFTTDTPNEVSCKIGVLVLQVLGFVEETKTLSLVGSGEAEYRVQEPTPGMSLQVRLINKLNFEPDKKPSLSFCLEFCDNTLAKPDGPVGRGTKRVELKAERPWKGKDRKQPFKMVRDTTVSGTPPNLGAKAHLSLKGQTYYLEDGLEAGHIKIRKFNP